MAIVDNKPKWDHDKNPLTKEYKEEHQYEFDYPYNGCLFDKCHQWFVDQRDILFGMVIGGGKQDIKNLANPYYKHKLDFTKVLV